ncbi:hypothetical protein [Thauera sp.]|uniref:hypothetical protein n=1 Tax=Thauera sp. TaxID=1905334 RepID=UPI002B6F6EF8|nr:hypothetical protein [Thauera sp.]HRP25360.1 hypothetical protein [Thauera sp.]
MRLTTIATAAALLGAATAVHAAAPLTPARAVAWLEAQGLQRPAGKPLPRVELVSDPGAYVDVPARYGAYSRGVVYLATWLPPAHRDAVLLHEVAHWMQPAGCLGARELEAHTLTARWMARTGRPGPRIPWAAVRAEAEACQ